MKAKLFAVLILALFALSPLAAYATTTSVTANDILITDVNYDDPVAPGTIMPIEVELTNAHSTLDFEDVQVKAWLQDTFGTRVGDKVFVGTMQIQQDSDKIIKLNLNVPSDVEPGDYTLVVEAEGIWEKASHRDTLRSEYTVEVQSNDDAFSIQKITAAKAEYNSGDNVDVAITVMNNGIDDQDNVVVSVAIPDLNIEKSIKLFGTLWASNSQTVYFTFALPKDADGGIYTMVSTAGNGLAKASASANLVIKAPIVISAETTGIQYTKADLGEIQIGKAKEIQLAITNKNTATRSYEIQVDADKGLTADASPTVFELRPGQTQTVTIAVQPENAGDHKANVVVMEDGKVISAVSLEAEGKTSITSMGTIIVALAVILAAFVIYTQFYMKNGSNGKPKTNHIYY